MADGSITTFAYDSHRNLTTATDSTGVTTLKYDLGDRLIEIDYPNGRFLKYTYDNAGRRTQMVDQAGFTVNYAYNPLGLLSTLTDGTGATIIAYTYNNLGQLAREDKGDGTYTTFQYDADGNVLHLVNYSPAGTVDSRFDYTYNALGQQTSMATLDGTWTYGYDQVGELTTAAFASTNPAVPSQNLAYTYDANGNRTQTVINGATTTYTANNLNQYTTVGNTTYQYDKDGNLVSSTTGSVTTTYTYDSLNRLVSMTTPTDTWTYSYNALNERVATTHNGQLTTNLVDPTGLGNVVGTYNNSGNLVANYTYGLGLVSQVAAGSKSYYDFDALGSTAGLTGPAGAVLNTYSYLPFGGTLNASGTAANPFTFVGQWGQTSGNGLDLTGARAYDPSTGRFTSQDPLNVLGSGTNLYNYVGNDPVNAIDPTGMVKSRQFAAGAVGFVGGVVGVIAGGYLIVTTGGVGAIALYSVGGGLLGNAAGMTQMVAAAYDEDANPPGDLGAIIGEKLGGRNGQAAGTLIYAALEMYFLPETGVPKVLKAMGDWAKLFGLVDTDQGLLFPDDGLPTRVWPGPPRPTNGIASSDTRYDSSGNDLAAVIVVSSNPLQITADPGSTQATANFLVENQGAIGSLLVYSMQGSLSGGSITFSQQPPPSGLEYNQTDNYIVTVTAPSGGFQPGQTYNGTITISATDPNVKQNPVTVTVSVTVPAPTFTLTGPTSGTYTAGQSVPIQWTAGNVAAGSTIALCYGTGTSFSNVTWITYSQAAADGSGSYSWNTTGVASGTYYIGGYLYSGGKPYYSHLTQPITIVGAGHYQVAVTQLVGSGYVYDDTGQIDTRIGKYVGTYTDALNHEIIAVADFGFSYIYNADTGALLNENFWHFTSSTVASGINVRVEFPDTLLQAASSPGRLPGGKAETLTRNALAPIVAAAIGRSQAAGLPAQDVSRLAGLNVQVANLPGPSLGVALPDGIGIDKDAAGYGWFVDPAPHDDSQFTQLAADVLVARPQTAAAGHADLLTAVMHELSQPAGGAAILDQLFASSDQDGKRDWTDVSGIA